jgi:hypothetical protein
VGRWSRVEKPSSGQPETAHWYYKGRLAIARQLRRSGERWRAVSMYRDVLDDAALSANQAKVALGSASSRAVKIRTVQLEAFTKKGWRCSRS